MEKAQIAELQNKIVEGMKIYAQKLWESKRRNNGKLAVYRDGKIMILTPSEIKP